MRGDFAKFGFVADANFDVFRERGVKEKREGFFDIGADLFGVADEDAVFAWFKKVVGFEVVFLVDFGVVILGLIFTVGMVFWGVAVIGICGRRKGG